ncbi:MAG: hypothetical protein ABIJ40_00025 [Bacteroidota bacterium]
MTKEAEIWMDKKIDNLLIIIGQAMVNRAKYYCTVATGRLRDSITFATSTEQSGIDGKATESDKIKQPSEARTVRIGTAVDYALGVEFGTRPHIIEPKTAKALYWKGAEHPVKRVKHPGTISQPFLRPALLTTNIKGIINKTGIFKA